jgi:hypothetical protein
MALNEALGVYPCPGPGECRPRKDVPWGILFQYKITVATVLDTYVEYITV